VSAASGTSPLFRESILRHFEQPEQQAAVRVWGEILGDLIGEGRGVLQGGALARWEHWRRDAAGALGDLQQAHEELAMAASLMEDADQGENGARLLVALADAADAVEPIIASLEAAIGRFVAGVSSRNDS
jgi:hypothetical protein